MKIVKLLLLMSGLIIQTVYSMERETPDQADWHVTDEAIQQNCAQMVSLSLPQQYSLMFSTRKVRRRLDFDDAESAEEASRRFRKRLREKYSDLFPAANSGS